MKAHVRLLGTPRIRLAHASFEPPLSKATSLLYYLAYKGEWCSRDELLYLFYPDAPESVGRSNLRQLLTSIRRLPISHGLIIETGRLCWPVETDVRRFQQAVHAGKHAEAVALYQGKLLEGCTLPEVPELESWLELGREELHGQWRTAVFASARDLEPGQATRLLHKVLTYDPLDEEALQAYMQAAAHAGQKTMAIRAYRSFSDHLKTELDIEPTSATQQLAAALKEGNEWAKGGASVQVFLPEPVEAEEPVTQARQRAPAALPGMATSFVGRVQELKDIDRLLNQTACRLLTILAVGGTGKTRLALQAMRAIQNQYADGCYFVALDSLSTPDGIPATVATALGFELKGKSDLLGQVIRAIGDKRMLLVLDNYEHLLEAATFCSELLLHCPELKLLVTSRERLNLAEEWLLPLEGLAVPALTASSEEVRSADAATLFIQRARQVRPDFTPAAEDLLAVAELCRLTQGSPLAIELAAVWVRVMSCADIAAELKKSIDILSSSTRNIPERHQSLRATLEHSWRLLTSLEQEMLRKLSVFQGGFRKEAASVIAGVPIAVLAALADKSLLRVSSGGRYDRHPLLHQFTQEKLSEHPEEQAELRERHGLYYLRLVREHYGDLLTHKRQATLTMIEEEHPNISAAWRWAVTNGRVDEIKASTWAIDTVYSHRAPEGRALLAEAIAGLDEANPNHQSALGYLLIQQGHFLFMLQGADAEHDASIERGLELFRRLGETPGLMRGLVGLGMSRFMKGDLAAAGALYREGLALARVHGTPRDISVYLGNLMAVERELSDAAQFRASCEATLAELKSLGDAMGYATLKFQLGVYLVQNDLQEGEALVQEGLNLIRELGDPRLEPFGYLALSACALGSHDEAGALAQKGLALAKESGDRLDEAQALTTLGRVAIAKGEHLRAQRYLKESLQVAWTAHYAFGVISALIFLADLCSDQGQPQEAAMWLGMVSHQPTFLKSHAREAKQPLERLREQLPEDELARALERGKALHLEKSVAEILRSDKAG